MRLERVFVLLGCSFPTIANVEKSIFLAPEADVDLPIPSSLDYQKYNIIRPWPSSRQIEIPAAFPKPDQPLGSDTWFVLEDLRPYQRYEVRICWAATVSAFKISIFGCRIPSGSIQ